MESITVFSSYRSALLTVALGVCVYYVGTFLITCLNAAFILTKIMRGLKPFPGPDKHWLYGNLHQMPGFNEEGIKWTESLVERYPRAMTFWVGPVMPKLLVYHPDTCKLILRSTEPKNISGIGGYELLRPWLGDGLLLSKGDKWFRNRRLLTPGFHFDVLKPYMEIYNNAADVFLNGFENSFEEGRSVEIFQPVSLCTLDVILKCAFSSDMEVQNQGECQPYVQAVIEMAKLIMERSLKPLMYWTTLYNMSPSGREFNRLRRLTHEVSDDVIKKRKAIIKRHPDFLDILLLARDDEGKGLTGTEIRDEVDTFLFEGHDTTASAISWPLYTLAQHPDHQQKCYEEVSKIISGRDTQHMQWDDLNSLSYLTLCIKECMRLHSPVPMIGREVDREFVMDGVTLAQGTFVEINIHALHHNKAVWGEDHNVFRPERFDTESADIDTFSFTPFSAGPRYKLSVDPAFPALHVPELVMRSEKGLYVFFTPRDKL